MPKILKTLRLRLFGSAASEAISVGIDGEESPRLRVDAGGRITWGPGSSAGDVYFERSGTASIAMAGATSPTLSVGTIRFADNTTLNTADIVGGGSSNGEQTVSDTAPAGAAEGDIWFNSSNLQSYVYYDGYWVQIAGGVGEGGGANFDISDTPPASPGAGDTWYDSTTGRSYIYYDSQWVEMASSRSTSYVNHTTQHVRGGSDVMDGDRLQVDYVPTAYTRKSAASGAGAVTDLAAHLGGIDDTLGAWTTYAATWSNITVGNGTSESKYKQIGKTVFFYAKFTFGSTSAIAGTNAVGVSLPVAMATGFGGAFTGGITDAGSGFPAMIVYPSGTTAVGGYASGTGGGYASAANISPTIPMTWAVNDNVFFAGVYEAA